MKWTSKLAVYLNIKNSPYNKVVDEFYNKLVDEGKFIGFDDYTAYVYFKGKVYAIWTANRFYAFLDEVWLCENEPPYYIREEGVFRNLRPSRKTEIRVYEWLERENHGIFRAKENPAIKILRNILKEN